MPGDAVLTRDGPVSVPLDYVVPQQGEFLPLTVRATIDGTSAASSFYATVQVIAPSGRVMGSYITSAIAAGASADVTWFPDLAPNPQPGLWYAVQPVSPATAPSPSAAGASFVNGWGNTILPDSTYSPLRYRLDPATNMVRIVGAISGGNFGSAAFVLPAAFRPADDVVMPITSADGSFVLAVQVLASSGAVIPLAGISTAGTPSGAAGGDLSASYPNPTVVAVEETGGPTRLAVGAIADGNFLKRSGSAVVGAAGGTITNITSTGGTITVTNGTGPTANVDLPTSGVTAGSYGDDSHVAAVTVNADGLVTAASSVAISGGSGTIGFEIGYDQITSSVNVTGTTSGAATTIITCAAHTFDGAAALLTFYCPEMVPPSSQAGTINIGLYESGSIIALLGQVQNANSGRIVVPTAMVFRFTPSAASHTYTIQSWVSATTGTPGVQAGNGASGNLVPTFVRFTKV